MVNVDAYPDENFNGRVYAVEPVVDERTRTVAMRARIPNKDNKLKPGMFVRVAVTLENRQNAVVVPEAGHLAAGQGQLRVQGGRRQGCADQS